MPTPEFEIIMAANPTMEALARAARKLILGVMPDATEVAWPKQNISSYGVGPKKMSEHFCYVAVLKARINLGFYYGADLADPDGLMEGTGIYLRHIKISSIDELNNPAVLKLVQLARGHLPKLK
jgi:hypothetical protein